MTVYTTAMRCIQLYMDDDIDEALSAAAARRGVSRSAYVRDAVRACLAAGPEAISDPLDALLGSVDVEPDADLDAVIYESFEIMRRERIAEVLAFDGDFSAAGFIEVRP